MSKILTNIFAKVAQKDLAYQKRIAKLEAERKARVAKYLK